MYTYIDSLFWKVTIEAMETWTISLFDWTSSYMYPLSCTIPAAGSWHCFWTMLGTINRRTGTLGAGASTATRAAWQEPWNRNDRRNRVMWCSEVLMKIYTCNIWWWSIYLYILPNYINLYFWRSNPPKNWGVFPLQSKPPGVSEAVRATVATTVAASTQRGRNLVGTFGAALAT